MAEYIEREALMKKFCGYDLTKCKKYGNEAPAQALRSFNTLMMYEIADVIEGAPTAEVAPVVHGRWKENDNFDDGFWVCSSCGFVSAATAAHKLYNFCPNCGADMREK